MSRVGAYVLYASVRSRQVTVGISADPLVTFAMLQGSAEPDPLRRFALLSPPLPMWVAEAALERARESLLWRALPPWGVRWRVHRALARLGERGAWRTWPDAGAPAPDPAELRTARQLLRGRILLEEEAVRLLEEEGEGRFTAAPPELIEGLASQGRLVRRSALQRDVTGRWRCRRCGARDQVDVGSCTRCGRAQCASCTECAHLGAARACEAVVIVEPDGDGAPEGARAQGPLLQMEFELSPAQRAASRALAGWQGARALVWAACGAGKTEVVYQAIEEALRRGDDVLFAVPRRDIAIELGERLQRAFPAVPVKALYGGAVRKFADAPLTVATTHQVLRFYRRFRLAILDEVDAFPYRGNPVLRRGVERALAPGGRLVYMTATPTEELLETAREQKWRVVTIPARHHGHPLPEPELLVLPELARTRRELERNVRDPDLPRPFAALVQRLVRTGRPLLVFVPTVALTAPTARLLDAVCRSGARPALDALPLAYGIHARDPRRDTLREAFRRGEFPVLVATTVLERGITVPAVNVIVLWADDERVFDAATLIQMAGRVGRTADAPDGEVHFAAPTASRPMHAARRCIAELNRLAREAGYLRAAHGGTGTAESVHFR